MESCDFCGKDYDTVYTVSDKLWEQITGINNGSGLFCPICFDKMARQKGIELYWKAKEGEYPY